MVWSFLQSLDPQYLILLVVLTITFLYFARKPVHAALYRVSRLMSSLLRLQARALAAAIVQIKQRNREVLLEIGKGRLERELNRDFPRVNDIVASDLSSYPDLQQTISRLVTRLEEDYHRSAETPPPSPDWVEAIDAIVNLKEAQKGNPVIVKVLEDLYASLEAQQKKTLDSYRDGVTRRHKLLHNMMPHWRSLNNAVERVGGSMKNLILHAEDIDKNMDKYKEISAGSDKAERRLRVSTSMDFITSVFWMALLAGGAFFNFQLISLPMSEMVGAGSRLGMFTVAEVSALMVVLIEIAMGMLLMELLRMTRMFSAFTTIDEKKRKILLWCLLVLIFFFASIEAGLAFMRHEIALDNDAVRALLTSSSGLQVVPPNDAISRFIPQFAQVGLSFILPFALIFVAVPFESFIESGRVLVASLIVQLLNIIVLVLRLLSVSVRYLTDILLAVYDVIVSIPLWIESKLESRSKVEKKSTQEASLVKDVS